MVSWERIKMEILKGDKVQVVYSMDLCLILCSFSYDGYKWPSLKNVLLVHLDIISIVFETVHLNFVISAEKKIRKISSLSTLQK